MSGGRHARRLAAVTSGHRGDVAAALGLLSDADAAVRAAALGALARCGALSADHIRRALGDEAAVVRCRAVELAPPEVELVGLLSDAEPSVVESAAAALGERDRDAGPVGELCRVARSHDDPLCRESAVAALGAIAAGVDLESDSPTDADAALAASDDAGQDSPSDTESASSSLVGRGWTGDAVSDVAPEAGQSSASEMALTGSAHEARAMALEVLLAAMSDRPQIRRRALLGLHQFDDDRAVAAVQAGLDDRDRQVRAVAGELLGVSVR